MPAPVSSAFRSGAAGCALLGGAVVALVVLAGLQRLAPPRETARRPPPRVAPAPPRPRRPPPPRPSPRPERAPAPEPVPEPQPEPSTEPAAPPLPAPGSFERTEDHGDYQLTWGFTDHQGEPLSVTCRVPRDDHEREVSRFGYDERAVAAARAERLRRWAEAKLRERGIEEVVRLDVDEEGWQARHEFPPNVDPAAAARLDVEARRFYLFMKLHFPDEWDAVTDALLRERGLRLDGQRIGIDYEGVADRAAGPLAGCTRALRWAAGRGADRRLLEVVLAFLQEIPYEQPSDPARGPRNFGFYVPTEVLVGNHGDCDSKAVAFAALWRRVDVPLVLVRVPGHMLLGVAVRPGPGERFVRLGNRYFVLCEVAGPARSRPGHTDAEGSFEYVLVGPAWS